MYDILASSAHIKSNKACWYTISNMRLFTAYVRSQVVPYHKKLRYTTGWSIKPTLEKHSFFPLIDYGDVVYNCLTQCDAQLLQKFQNSALHLILNCDNWTKVEDMPNQLEQNFGSYRWLQHCQTQYFKCINRLAPKGISSLINHLRHEHCMTTQAEIPLIWRCQTWSWVVSRKDFRNWGPVCWNRLNLTLNGLIEFKR